MKLTIVDSIRTNNFNDELLLEKIGRLWQEASQKIMQSDVIKYGVYYDYESDYKGDYTLSIAIEDGQDIDGTKSQLHIPVETQYELFRVNRDDPEGILNTWQEIWNLVDAGFLKRAYTYDYEKYYPSGEVEVYIAIQ